MKGVYKAKQTCQITSPYTTMVLTEPEKSKGSRKHGTRNK